MRFTYLGTLALATALAGSSLPQAQPNAGVQATNDAFVKQITDQLGANANAPAEQAFKNIQWLKGIPASRLLLIMNVGYSRALGVACTHCHDPADFASDAKRPKKAAREMAAMHREINTRLSGMQNLESPPGNRAINCSTCHRGSVKPPL